MSRASLDMSEGKRRGSERIFLYMISCWTEMMRKSQCRPVRSHAKNKVSQEGSDAASTHVVLVVIRR